MNNEETPLWLDGFKREFPTKFWDYIFYLERQLKAPIKMISVGPERKQTISR